jgi:quercetin dioxygenase-like cupin family protein
METDAMAASEEIKMGGLTVRYLVEGDEANRTVAMFELDVEPGSKVPGPHSHNAYEETVYGLEGVLTFTVGETITEVGTGKALVIPRGAVHRFDNLHSVTAKLLTVITPGILGPDYFREVAGLLRASAEAPPDLAALGEIMQRHGLTPAR